MANTVSCRALCMFLLISVLATPLANAEAFRLRFMERSHVVRTPMWEKIIATWNVRNPDIQVGLESVSGNWAALNDRLLIENATGSPPDIVRVGVAYWPALYDHDLLCNIGPFLDRVGFNYGEYFPAIKAYEREGGLYGLPAGVTSWPCISTKNILREQA